MAAFTAAERRDLARALAAGGTPRCPACDIELSQRRVPPSKQVAYVRRRTWLLCPECGRTGAVDARIPPVNGDAPP